MINCSSQWVWQIYQVNFQIMNLQVYLRFLLEKRLLAAMTHWKSWRSLRNYRQWFSMPWDSTQYHVKCVRTTIRIDFTAAWKLPERCTVKLNSGRKCTRATRDRIRNNQISGPGWYLWRYSVVVIIPMVYGDVSAPSAWQYLMKLKWSANLASGRIFLYIGLEAKSVVFYTCVLIWLPEHAVKRRIEIIDHRPSTV